MSVSTPFTVVVCVSISIVITMGITISALAPLAQGIAITCPCADGISIPFSSTACVPFTAAAVDSISSFRGGASSVTITSASPKSVPIATIPNRIAISATISLGNPFTITVVDRTAVACPIAISVGIQRVLVMGTY